MTEAKAPYGNQERSREEVVSAQALKDDNGKLGMEELRSVSPGGTTVKGKAYKKHYV